MTHRSGGKRVIEDRVWLAYPGFACVVVGLVVWGVQTRDAAPERWVATPVVDADIASFGRRIITTVLVTNAIELNMNAGARTRLVVNFISQT